jgi:hypothetical protein
MWTTSVPVRVVDNLYILKTLEYTMFWNMVGFIVMAVGFVTTVICLQRAHDCLLKRLNNVMARLERLERLAEQRQPEDVLRAAQRDNTGIRL